MAQDVFTPRRDSRNSLNSLVVTLTPTRAQAFARCPQQYAETFDAQRDDGLNWRLQVGQYIHALVHQYNRTLMRGLEPDIDDVLMRVRPPLDPDHAGDDGDQHLRDVAYESILGYQKFLRKQEFTAIVGSEHYVRTPARPVLNVPDCAIVFAGRFDVVATRDAPTLDGFLSITCIDVKTGALTPELAEQPSSFIYAHLARHAYRVDDVEILQIAPRSGQWTSIRLTQAQIEAGTEFCRDMVAALKEGNFPPQPGGYCQHCRIVDRCPAHQSRPEWNTPF